MTANAADGQPSQPKRTELSRGELFLRMVFWSAIMVPIGGWALMLAVGVVHGSWIPQVPPLGYWPAVAVVFLAYVVRTVVRPAEYAIRRLAER